MLHRHAISLRRVAALCALSVLAACSSPPPDADLLGSFDYATVAWPSCVSAQLAGIAGASNDEISPLGLKFAVRTPANYNPAVQHPLIVVYAPARHHRRASEKLLGLTHAATAAGFVIAYADSKRLSLTVIEALSHLPAAVASKWCIDRSRIYVTGHSDGGTIAVASAVLPGMDFRPRAIAPSAAGMRGEDMAAQQCPRPTAVMTMQNSDDELFPNFGREVATWWVACNACETPPIRVNKRCVRYPNCANAVATWFCESPAGHRQWPGLNAEIIAFFADN